MSNFIPKERTGAYRPWKLTSLDGGAASTRTREKEDAERVKAINQQAYRQGYDAGFAQGAATAAAEAARLGDLTESLQQELSGLEQRVAEDLVRLALTLARSLVRESLKVHPELIEAIVRESVRDIPPFSQRPRIRMHPDDARLLTGHLAAEIGPQWSIIEDQSVTRGGCRVETSSCEIDATLETRWQKLCAALAQDSDWIA
jgi:flagellar assembly protein FliH